MFFEIVISLLIAWSIWGALTYIQKRKMPPGPFPLPFIGNTLQMMSAPKNPFEKLAEQYGDIFTFYRPAGPVVVLNNATLIRDARLGRKDDLSGRSPEHMYPFNQIFGSNDVSMSDYSPGYLFRRRVFKSAMHVFGSGMENAADRARHAVDLTIEQIERKHGQPFSPKEFLDNAILAQIWGWLSAKSEALDGLTVKSLREYLNILTDIAYQSPLFHLFPFLKFFPSQFRRNVERAREINYSIFTPEFHAHYETYTPGTVRDLTDSFINAYEKEIAKETGKDIGSIGDIPNLMANVAFGASDTTSSSLAWFILYVALREDVQRKIQEEIDTAIGNDRLPNLQDTQNLPYLQSTLCEVQRIAAVIPFTGSNAIRDITIDGYDIPKGTFVLLNLKKAHCDEREWQEPNEFKPERFLDSDGKFVGWTKLHGFIPFSVGRRECAGTSLAKVMMFIFASTLLQRYKIELPEGSEKLSTESPFISAVVRPKDFQVVAKER